MTAAQAMLMDRLRIWPESRVSVLGIDDEVFLERLEARAEWVATGRPVAESDAILLQVDDLPALGRLASLEPFLSRGGTIWVVFPQGVPHITARDVRNASLDCGLAAVEALRFSDRCAAMKLVVPAGRR